MLTENSLIVSQLLLSFLVSKNGETNKDEYAKYLRSKGYDYRRVVVPTVQSLIFDYNLVSCHGKDDYYLRITIEGEKAEKIGLKKYLKQKEKGEKDEAFLKKATLWDKKIGIITAIASLVSLILGILLSNPIKGLLKKLLEFF